MTYAKGRHPGAVWKKSDFEIHTPRDPGWSGSHLPGGEQKHEEKRREWAATFVKECVSRELMAIAITDHHDFCLIPYVQEELKKLDESTRPWLFPGIEITCNDSVQCLFLFDVNSEPQAWQRLYGKMPSITPAAANDPTCPAAELCGKDLACFMHERF
jgi:chromosome segregation protein